MVHVGTYPSPAWMTDSKQLHPLCAETNGARLAKIYDPLLQASESQVAEPLESIMAKWDHCLQRLKDSTLRPFPGYHSAAQRLGFIGRTNKTQLETSAQSQTPNLIHHRPFRFPRRPSLAVKDTELVWTEQIAVRCGVASTTVARASAGRQAPACEASEQHRSISFLPCALVCIVGRRDAIVV